MIGVPRCTAGSHGSSVELRFDVQNSVNWGPAQLASGGVNSSAADARPNVQHDGLEIVWDSTRTGSLNGSPDKSAIDLLRQARAKGWLPDGIWYPLDIAQEPTFRSHRDDPRFIAVRRQILAHIARERSELGPVRI